MQSYHTLSQAPPSDAIVVRLYRSGNMVKGYVRRATRQGENDTIFPGEEMDPESALMLARSHAEGAPIYVELLEDVKWDDRWGLLDPPQESPRLR
ncbi:hypothetical protein LAC81_36770 (plasmid) [Ensifer adhaerens]|uniref:hypothetical protein n=1 Tax=Ensifer adhaerens TaxID=106592 RepID=UPI001CBDC7FE|nr:hypothetical protein [Ensifer adhaerens]MBZ7927493.1 hypothetical protein [Ensifer adhaerens]UAX97916.1 hypothetical protein LAC78_38075 [Ensifer adhaerens]UAY05295.1 hypothetical protein LAC80_36785 [Ensifer adhaerens]UAY12673.1 hypothetical protein LAC81_36770 [Ensifer adhaerens]